MAAPQHSLMARRRQRQEEGYEKIIVTMAIEIVSSETTPERRKRCQESLLNACLKVAAFHNMSPSHLYWLPIRKASEGKS